MLVGIHCVCLWINDVKEWIGYFFRTPLLVGESVPYVLSGLKRIQGQQSTFHLLLVARKLSFEHGDCAPVRRQA